MDNSVKEKPQISSPDNPTPTAKDLLEKFMLDNNIEIKLTPIAQIIENGTVIIQPQQVVADFKKDSTIKTN